LSNNFEVWLDEERQIVRQRMHGEPDLPQFLDILAKSEACAQRLRQPDVVRILIDGEWLGRMPRPVRAASAEALRKPELRRIAVVTKNAGARMMIRFVSVATGVNKMRAFPDEETALAWLLS
jgi:hypothetical protein